ncbi:MAG: winged helix-turn-helix domain-containing protein [Rhodobacteraceae bacterium]|nr:winged helix-turn-helix domain-containing protein [Paracoccaceae bacterium]
MVDPQGELHPLRPQSVRALSLFSTRAGKVVTRDEIFAEVWPDPAVTDDSLTQCIGDIRGALGNMDRRILETIPRCGFRLHPDPAPARRFPFGPVMPALLGAAALLLAGAVWRDSGRQMRGPTVSIVAAQGTDPLSAEVGVPLDRDTRICRLSEGGRFVLELSKPSAHPITAELVDTSTSAVLLSQSLPDVTRQDTVEIEGVRLATRVASPTSGAIAQALIGTLRDKPIAALTTYVCYLHSFRWRFEALFRRAQACLTTLAERDPENATALAFLGATYVARYWYGTGLDGPARDDRPSAAAGPGSARVGGRGRGRWSSRRWAGPPRGPTA